MSPPTAHDPHTTPLLQTVCQAGLLTLVALMADHAHQLPRPHIQVTQKKQDKQATQATQATHQKDTPNQATTQKNKPDQATTQKDKPDQATHQKDQPNPARTEKATTEERSKHQLELYQAENINIQTAAQDLENIFSVDSKKIINYKKINLAGNSKKIHPADNSKKIHPADNSKNTYPPDSKIFPPNSKMVELAEVDCLEVEKGKTCELIAPLPALVPPVAPLYSFDEDGDILPLSPAHSNPPNPPTHFNPPLTLYPLNPSTLRLTPGNLTPPNPPLNSPDISSPITEPPSPPLQPTHQPQDKGNTKISHSKNQSIKNTDISDITGTQRDSNICVSVSREGENHDRGEIQDEENSVGENRDGENSVGEIRDDENRVDENRVGSKNLCESESTDVESRYDDDNGDKESRDAGVNDDKSRVDGEKSDGDKVVGKNTGPSQSSGMKLWDGPNIPLPDGAPLPQVDMVQGSSPGRVQVPRINFQAGSVEVEEDYLEEEHQLSDFCASLLGETGWCPSRSGDSGNRETHGLLTVTSQDPNAPKRFQQQRVPFNSVVFSERKPSTGDALVLSLGLGADDARTIPDIASKNQGAARERLQQGQQGDQQGQRQCESCGVSPDECLKRLGLHSDHSSPAPSPKSERVLHFFRQLQGEAAVPRIGVHRCHATADPEYDGGGRQQSRSLGSSPTLPEDDGRKSRLVAL